MTYSNITNTLRIVMRSCYLSVLAAFAAASVLGGCGGKEPEALVRFADVRHDHALTARLKNVEWIALEADGVHLLGDAPELVLAGDGSLLLVDRRAGNVFRYGADGRFLNTLGRRGNGPGEYRQIANVQDCNGELLVFDYPNRILSFSYDGRLNSTAEHLPGLQFWKSEQGLLSYQGFGMGLDHRLSLSGSGDAKTFLTDDSDAKVLHFSQDVPIFHEAGQTVYFTDSYKPVVRAFHQGKVSDALTVDFGAYSIPKSFYSHDDSFAAMEELLSRPFAIINRYFRSEELAILEVFLQDVGGKARYAYAIQADGKWNWFGLGEAGKDPFAGALRQLKGNQLYFLVDATLAGKAGVPDLPAGSDYLVCRMAL